MVLIGAACGVGLALGVLTVLIGACGTTPLLPLRPRMPAGGREKLLLQATAAVGVGIGMLALTGWPVGGLMTAVAAGLVPAALKRMRAETDTVARTEAVAAWTEMLRDTLAAAAGLEEAVRASAQVAPESISSEVERLSRRLEREPLVEALKRFADEVSNPAADLVVVALVTAARREARDLVPLLGALAHSARAEAEMRLRVNVSRARIRTAVRVVTGTLVLFAGGLVLFNRPYLEPYGTGAGQLMLLLVGTIFAVGGWLLHRMARIEGPERFFGGDPVLQGRQR